MTSLAAALAGGNLIYESSGMTAALLGVSFEAFILDDEMHAMTYRALRSVRDEPRTWDRNGAQDAWSGANTRARQILGEHRPEYLGTAVDEAIRSRFNILL